MPGQGTSRRRRRLLKLALAAPLTPALRWTLPEVEAAQQAVQNAQSLGTFSPGFFTEHEYRTVRLLADWILPRDERSGSAADAGVPEFMDFMMIDQPERQTAMRGGLQWLDFACQLRFDRRFVECGDDQRRALLDLIAWPAKAPAEMAHGVEFFNRFRDLTATGFWTSKIGFEDLQFMGNEFVAEWKGCPDDALRKLGLKD